MQEYYMELGAPTIKIWGQIAPAAFGPTSGVFKATALSLSLSLAAPIASLLLLLLESGFVPCEGAGREGAPPASRGGRREQG